MDQEKAHDRFTDEVSGREGDTDDTTHSSTAADTVPVQRIEPSISSILNTADTAEWLRHEEKKSDSPPNRALTGPPNRSRVSDPSINAIINTPDTDERLRDDEKSGKAASYFAVRATTPGAVSMGPNSTQKSGKSGKTMAKKKPSTVLVAANRVSDPSIAIHTPHMDQWLQDNAPQGGGKAASHFADARMRAKKGVAGVGAVAVGPNINFQDNSPEALAHRKRLIQQYANSDPRVCRKTLAHAYAGGSSSMLPSSRSFETSRRTSSFDAIDEIVPLPLTSLSRNERLRQELAPGAYGGTPSTEFERREKVPFALVGNHPSDRIAHQSTATLDPSERHPSNEQGDLEQQQPADRRRSEAQRQQKTRLILVASVVLVLLILIATVVGVVVGTGSSSDNGKAEEAVPDPAQMTKIFNQQLQKVFPDPASVLPEKTIQAIESGKANNPQRKALEWVVADPKLQNYSTEQKRQRFALATLYYATNGPSWFDDVALSEIGVPWLSYGRHECEWFSLVYSKTQEPCHHFTTEDQREQHIPLESLVLSGNPAYTNNGINPALKGTLPPQVGLLSNLHTLDLGFQKLRGSIPTELEQLSSSLREIVLVKSFYTGTIPESIFEFASILQLDRNDRLDAGSIPATVGLNTDLRYLSLIETNRQGPIPTQLFSATKLETLFLNENKFTGALPTEIGLLKSSLRLINMPSNSLTGSIPSELGLLNQLDSFLAGGNRFSSSLPTQMDGLTSLLELDLGKNRLTGSIPLQFGSLTKLERLDLKENNLKAGLPASLETLSKLAYLDLSNNGLQGLLLPTLVASWSELQNLRLASNQMTGSVPSQVGRLASLTELTLRSNRFDSSLPSELGLLSGLRVLRIEGTQISGQVPDEVCSLSSLEQFSIECSHLECPSEECSCTCA